jgi:hypothetical protein
VNPQAAGRTRFLNLPISFPGNGNGSKYRGIHTED